MIIKIIGLIIINLCAIAYSAMFRDNLILAAIILFIGNIVGVILFDDNNTTNQRGVS